MATTRCNNPEQQNVLWYASSAKPKFRVLQIDAFVKFRVVSWTRYYRVRDFVKFRVVSWTTYFSRT